jgi:phage-related protein
MSFYLNERAITDTVRDVFSVEGALAPPVAVRAVQPLANTAGVWGSSVSVTPRQVTVMLDVWPSTLADRVTAMDDIARRVSGLRLLRMADSPTREIWVHLTGLRVEFYHIAIPRCAVELQFTAIDPTRYERERRAVALSTSRTASAIGTVPSAPLVYLYGGSPSVVNPIVIVRNASGDETHRLTLAGTLATNDALVIDSAKQTIARYVAGVLQTGTASGNAWLASGAFPLLAPEDSVDGDGVTVELTATSGTPTGLMLYTRGY